MHIHSLKESVAFTFPNNRFSIPFICCRRVLHTDHFKAIQWNRLFSRNTEATVCFMAQEIITFQVGGNKRPNPLPSVCAHFYIWTPRRHTLIYIRMVYWRLRTHKWLCWKYKWIYFYSFNYTLNALGYPPSGTRLYIFLFLPLFASLRQATSAAYREWVYSAEGKLGQ